MSSDNKGAEAIRELCIIPLSETKPQYFTDGGTQPVPKRVVAHNLAASHMPTGKRIAMSVPDVPLTFVSFHSVTFSRGEKKWPLCESIIHCFALFCHMLGRNFQGYGHQLYCETYKQLHNHAEQIETRTREFINYMMAQKCAAEDIIKVVKETMEIYRLYLDTTTQEIPLGRDVHVHALDYVSGFVDGGGPILRPLDVMSPPMEVTIPLGHYDDIINSLRALFFGKAYHREIIVFVPVDSLIALITGYLFDIHRRPSGVKLVDRPLSIYFV